MASSRKLLLLVCCLLVARCLAVGEGEDSTMPFLAALAAAATTIGHLVVSRNRCVHMCVCVRARARARACTRSWSVREVQCSAVQMQCSSNHSSNLMNSEVQQ
jgi:hypothetical protein